MYFAPTREKKFWCADRSDDRHPFHFADLFHRIHQFQTATPSNANHPAGGERFADGNGGQRYVGAGR